MAGNSAIEWTDMTWNPVTGCTKVSQGCKHCYAERMAIRLRAMGAERYASGFEVALHEDLMDAPKRWRSPRTIFVNSMSDLFHEQVPLNFIARVFSTIADCPWHTFQALTKRSARLAEVADLLQWPDNLWMGVSVENETVQYRIGDLRTTPARLKFLSLEPLLGPLPWLDLRDIDWVIVGGESGPHARPMREEWVHNIRHQCEAAGVAFFFKQWGGAKKHKTGRQLNGRTYDELPAPVRLHTALANV